MKDFKLSNYGAAVFDLDGTLLDTLQDISEAANRSLQQHGHDMHPQEAFCHFVGDGPDVLFQRAIQAESVDDPRVTRLVETYQTECTVQDDKSTSLYDGIPELLTALNQYDIPLTILTNKLQPHAELCVERFMSQWRWQIVLGSGDHVPKKPDPKGALQVAATLGAAPKSCLYFGDTDVDMLTAKRAGMTAVGVLWGFRDRAELERTGADFIIEHPSELL